jgi:gamma-glutamyl-gamma-aminobutyrate hydrolase PuuD
MTVIGLTTYAETARMLVWHREFALLHASYISATERGRGCAVLLPPQATGAGDAAADEVIDRIDGLVLTGGADVDPARYGELPAERTSGPRVQRDEWEIALTRAALRRDLPLLAICRGLQVLNVVLGGTLHQHLPDLTGHEGHQPGPGVFGAVDVNIEPGTRTAELIGPRVRVSCHHHQALARLAPGLKVAGRAADGTVEAVEVPGRSFALGVQWHPEENSQDDRLFAALASAGQRYRERLKAGERL